MFVSTFDIWSYSLLFKHISCKHASKCANRIWVCFQKCHHRLGRYEIKVTWTLLCVGMWHVNSWSVQNRLATELWFWLLMLQCLEFVWQTSGISSHFHHISGYTNTFCYYYKILCSPNNFLTETPFYSNIEPQGRYNGAVWDAEYIHSNFCA